MAVRGRAAMASNSGRKKRNRQETKPDVHDILGRVDPLVIPDPRSPDEILSYAENGLPTGTENAKWPDLAERAKSVLADRVFDSFLKYRHREWEEGLCEGKNESPKAGTDDPIIGKK